MKKTFTCIVCPVSCRITVEAQGDEQNREQGEKPVEALQVSGNACKNGYHYAINEYTLPKRSITTTVAVKQGLLRRLPVVSDREIPKSKIMECMKALYTIEVAAPIKRGDIIAENICNTGANILASSDGASPDGAWHATY